MSTPGMSVPLSQSTTTVLNSSGNGTISLGPISAREIWSPQTVHVQCQQPVTNEAKCTIYVGYSATQDNFRDATWSGSSGDSSSKVNADTVKCGHFVWASWTGGDPGSVATLVVTGTKTI
jgi:hypothetical protein